MMLEYPSVGGKDDSDNHSVKSESFSEDENKDHSHEDLLLLCIGSNSSVSYNSDGETCSL